MWGKLAACHSGDRMSGSVHCEPPTRRPCAGIEAPDSPFRTFCLSGPNRGALFDSRWQITAGSTFARSSSPTAEHWKAGCRRSRRRKKQTRTSPPIAWKPADDELLSRSSLAKAARLTGRTLAAVRKRRRILGLPDGRLAAQKGHRDDTLREQADVARLILRSRTEPLVKSLAQLSQTWIQSKATLPLWQLRLSYGPTSRQGIGSSWHCRREVTFRPALRERQSRRSSE